MRPELFRVLDVGFPSYFVLLVTGFAFAIATTIVQARRQGLDPDPIVDAGLMSLLLGVVGARVLHVLADGYFLDYVHLCTDPSLVDWKVSRVDCVSAAYDGAWDAARAVCHPRERDCLAWAKFWAGGLTYYGGFLFAAPTLWWSLRREGIAIRKVADLAGGGIALGLAFGRMGCLLAGCCFGARSDAPWALAFPPGSPASEAQFKAGELASMHLASHPVHPTQLYESVGSLALAAFCLLWLHPRKRYDGQVFLAFLAGYAVLRFVLEFLRRDDRGGAAGLSTSQLIGVGLVVVAIALHRVFRRKLPGSAAAA